MRAVYGNRTRLATPIAATTIRNQHILKARYSPLSVELSGISGDVLPPYYLAGGAA